MDVAKPNGCVCEGFVSDWDTWLFSLAYDESMSSRRFVKNAFDLRAARLGLALIIQIIAIAGLKYERGLLNCALWCVHLRRVDHLESWWCVHLRHVDHLTVGSVLEHSLCCELIF